MLCRFCGNVICGKCGEHQWLHPRTNSNKRICTKCNASVAFSLPSGLSPTEKHGLCGAEWRDVAFAYFHENIKLDAVLCGRCYGNRLNHHAGPPQRDHSTWLECAIQESWLAVACRNFRFGKVAGCTVNCAGPAGGSRAVQHL